MDKAVLLLSQYCDNDLSPEDQAELEQWLRADPANVDRFVRATHLSSNLHDVVQERRLQSTAWSHTLQDSDPYLPIPSAVAETTTEQSHRRLWFLAAAALLGGVIAAIGIWPSLQGPALVAQVTSLNGAVTTASGQRVLVGTLLPQGETLRVVDGDVLVTFVCGAKVLVEENSVFAIESASAGFLIDGQASANVPTQAIGFAIRTELLEVIDLGTEFQLKILDANRIDLHVFDGLVEVRLGKAFRHAEDGPLNISEGRSARFDLQANEVITLNYDESLKRQF